MTLWQRIASLTQPSGGTVTSTSADGSNTVAFTMAVIALGAKMAKADGVVSPIEVEAFHQVFKTPRDQAGHVAQVFDLAQRDIAGFESYANQVRDLLGGDQQKLRDVLECLFHIASADRALHSGEDKFLHSVAECFGFSDSTYRHIRAQFVEDHGAPYDVLGLDPSVSDADLKVRHRKLVRENHPDLMTGRGMPVEAIDVANRKLAAINAAFAIIAKERGL
jgi:DnaJ like chaperone protein